MPMPSQRALTQLQTDAGSTAVKLIEHANEMRLLAARFEDLLEEVAPHKLGRLRHELYRSAQSCRPSEYPYWTTRTGISAPPDSTSGKIGLPSEAA